MATVYVDPAIAGDSGTGTIGDPFGDLQYALNNTTQGAGGDIFHIKAGTSEILAAALTLATYGTPAYNKPLIFSGYTSTAFDGGKGVIDGNATYSIMPLANAPNYMMWIDLHLTNTGTNDIVEPKGVTQFIRCEFSNGTGHGVDCTNQTRISASGCYFHDIGASGKSAWLGTSGTGVYSSVFVRGSNAAASMIYATYAVNNIIVTSGATRGIEVSAGGIAAGNTIYGGGSATGEGIYMRDQMGLIANNIITGFAGAGGDAITGDYPATAAAIHNAVYNNTAGVNSSFVFKEGNDTLSGDPFVDAASNDFTIDGSVTGATEDAWPKSWPGLTTSTAPLADKGAVQAGAGAGGGGVAYPVVGSSIIRGVTL